MFKKNCALALSMLLMLSSLFPASVYANTVDEGSRSVLTVSEVEEKLVEDHQDAQEKDVSEVKTTVEKVAFHEERILDGIRISVTADAGVFPKGSVLKAKKLVKQTDKKKVEASIEEKLKEEDATLAESFIFDISIRDKDGEEIQPDTSQGEVKVSFEQLDLSALQNGKELAVFHLDEVEAEAEKLEDVEVKHAEEKVEVTAEHFSLFVVSFIDKKDDVAMSTGMVANDSLTLKKLFEENGYIYYDAFHNVQAVSSDHEDIVSISKNDDGEVLLKALKEGEAIIKITQNTGKITSFRIIVQKPYDQGRIGENMVYVVSGEEGKMTLTIKGYGLSDDQARVPWFPYRDQIQKVIIEKNVESLNIDSAFAEMKNLEEVILPNTLIDIPYQAFYHSDNLKDVTIPASVEDIGHNAFVKENSTGEKNKIKNLSSVFLSSPEFYDENHTTVEQTATKKAEEPANLKLKVDTLKFYTYPGIASFLEIQTSEEHPYNLYFIHTDDASKVITLDDFKDGDNFKNALRLNRSTWSTRLNKNLQKVFHYSEVKESEWQNNTTYYCYVVATRTAQGKTIVSNILKTTVKVGDPANLLPEQEGSLKWKMTKEGNDLESNRPIYKLSISGNDIPDASLPNGLRPWNKVLYALRNSDPKVKLELSEGITRLGKDALRGIDTISGDLILPDSIREIADSVFSNVSFEGKIKFPAQLKTIGNNAFEESRSTADLVLPEGLQSIGESAFRGNNIGNITIPTTVRKIGLYAFYKDEMGLDGKNTITNKSNVKLSDRYANLLFTNFEKSDSAEAGIIPPRRGGGGSNSGGSGGGGGAVLKVSAGNNSVSSAPVNWQKDDKGWWVKNEDGSYPKNEWKQINNNWYFFNGEGYMATGWVALNNAWYYLDTTEGSNNGMMSTGWKLLNDSWYFLSQEAGANNGKMLAGWQLINGKWYYFSTEAGANYGKMLANTVVDGYTLGADGAWNMQPKKAA